MPVSSPPNNTPSGLSKKAGAGHGKALRLTDAGRLFRATGGGVDVFALGLDGPLEAHRLPLFRVEEGEFLAGLGFAAHICLIGVPAAGAKLEPIETPGGMETGALAAGIDGWVARVMRAAAIPPPVQVYALAEGGLWSLIPDRAIRPETSVMWLNAITGEAAILGSIPIPSAMNTPVPVAPDGFVIAATQAKLNARPSSVQFASACEHSDLAEVFGALGERLLPLISARLAAATQDQKQRLAESQTVGRTLWQRAIDRLDRVLDSGAAIMPPSQWDNDDVFCTLKALAAFAGVRAVAPNTGGARAGVLRERLEAIGRTSRFRIRAIELPSGWWREEIEPCFAMLSGGEAGPIALLPRKGGGAVAVNPRTGARTVVGNALADQIDRSAFAIHWSLPSGPLTASSLLRFALRGRSGALATIACATVASAVLGLLMPVLAGVIVGRIIPNAELDQLGQFLALLFGAAAASFSFALFRMLTLLRLRGHIDQTLQNAVWDRLLNMPAGFFGGMSAGDLANRALSINWISATLGGALIGAVVAGVASLLSLAVMAYFSWRLTIVAIVAVTVVLAAASVIARSMIAAQRDLFQAQGHLIGRELQLLTAASKLQIAGATPRAFANWAEQFALMTRHSFRSAIPQCQIIVLNQVFQPLAILAILMAIVLFADKIDTADFVAFNAAFGQFLGMMMGMVFAMVMASVAIPLYERAKPILQTLPEDAASRADPGELTGAITLRSVRFRYGNDGPAILDGFDLDIRAGEYVAIAGPSGAGKSTLIRLLLGFERPETGEVAYDGKNIEDLDLYLLRRQIGVVLQRGQLLPASLFENIVNHGNYTQDDAWEAAEQAGLAETIRAMPMGMQTFVSEGSGTISGGERQRLMITRAFIRKPRILLLDEATSALDNETQAVVTAALEKLTATRIVIAHRLSTIERVDRIVVFGQGKVVEQGCFQELMAKQGPFYSLAKRQLI